MEKLRRAVSEGSGAGSSPSASLCSGLYSMDANAALVLLLLLLSLLLLLLLFAASCLLRLVVLCWLVLTLRSRSGSDVTDDLRTSSSKCSSDDGAGAPGSSCKFSLMLVCKAPPEAGE